MNAEGTFYYEPTDPCPVCLEVDPVSHEHPAEEWSTSEVESRQLLMAIVTFRQQRGRYAVYR